MAHFLWSRLIIKNIWCCTLCSIAKPAISRFSSPFCTLLTSIQSSAWNHTMPFKVVLVINAKIIMPHLYDNGQRWIYKVRVCIVTAYFIYTSSLGELFTHPVFCGGACTTQANFCYLFVFYIKRPRIYPLAIQVQEIQGAKTSPSNK